MNRKYLILALILTLTLVLSVGAFAEKITVWSWYDGTLGAAFKQLVEEDFEAKTGIEVDLQTVPIADMNTKLLLAVVGGDAPDVVELYSNQVVELGVRGALYNIANMPELQSTFDQMLPGLMRQLSYRDAIFALPGEVNWAWTYYRTDILQEIGAEVPKTWDEMKSLSNKLKAREMEIYYDWQGDTASRSTGRLLPFVFQRGTDIYTEDGQASNLDDPRVIEGFKELIGLFQDYKWPLEDPGYQTFIDGATPIQIYQNWYYSVWERSPQIAGKWEIDEVPGTLQKDGTIDRTNTGKMLTWSITTPSKQKEAAAKFLEWSVSPEFVAKFSKMVYNSPDKWRLFFSSRDGLDQSGFPEEQMHLAKAALDNVKMQRAIVGGYVADRYIDFAFHSVVLQNKDPEEALKSAAKDSTDEIQRKLKEFSRLIATL